MELYHLDILARDLTALNIFAQDEDGSAWPVVMAREWVY